MRRLLSFEVLLLVIAAATLAQGVDPPIPTDPNVCLGEYSVCKVTGECSLGACGVCKKGEYVCPDQTTCVASAADYLNCPNLKGTHLDWTLSEDARLEYLVAHTTLAEQVTDNSVYGRLSYLCRSPS